MAQGKLWTNEELTFLSSNAKKMTARQIGEVIGRTSKAVRSKANYLKVSLLKEVDAEDNEVLERNNSTEESCIDTKDLDYKNFILRTQKVKRILEIKGKIGPYTLVKAYKDKALLNNKKGHRVCLTYAELVIKLRGYDSDKTQEKSGGQKGQQKGQH